MRKTWARSSTSRPSNHHLCWHSMEQNVVNCKYGCSTPPTPIWTPPWQRYFATSHTPWACSAMWLVLANGMLENAMQAKTCKAMAHWSLPSFVAGNSFATMWMDKEGPHNERSSLSQLKPQACKWGYHKPSSPIWTGADQNHPANPPNWEKYYMQVCYFSQG